MFLENWIFYKHILSCILPVSEQQKCINLVDHYKNSYHRNVFYSWKSLFAMVVTVTFLTLLCYFENLILYQFAATFKIIRQNCYRLRKLIFCIDASYIYTWILRSSIKREKKSSTNEIHTAQRMHRDFPWLMSIFKQRLSKDISLRCRNFLPSTPKWRPINWVRKFYFIHKTCQ